MLLKIHWTQIERPQNFGLYLSMFIRTSVLSLLTFIAVGSVHLNIHLTYHFSPNSNFKAGYFGIFQRSGQLGRLESLLSYE